MGETIKRLRSWAGAITGMFGAASGIWEIATRPNRDVWVEMIGSVISLHSLYFGAVVIFAAIALVCSIRVVCWVLKWFYRCCTDKGRFVAAAEENLRPGDPPTTSRERFCSKLWALGIKPRRSESHLDEEWLEFRDHMAAYAFEGKLDYAKAYRPPEGKEWHPPQD